MSIKDLLSFQNDASSSILFYMIIFGVTLFGIVLYYAYTEWFPERDFWLENIPIMDCKELGNAILGKKIITYSEVIDLAHTHWEIRCHGGLSP